MSHKYKHKSGWDSVVGIAVVRGWHPVGGEIFRARPEARQASRG